MTGAIDRFASLDGRTLPAALQSVKDAPLFIDDSTLDRFYDAVVRPAFVEKGPRVLRISESEKRDLQAKLAGAGKVGLPAWLTSIFSADVQVSAEGQVATGGTGSREHTIQLEAISTPQRQLEQLVPYYLLRQPDRLFSGGMDGPVRSGGRRRAPVVRSPGRSRSSTWPLAP